LDSIKLFPFNANVIPDFQRGKYLGYISCDDIFNEFSKYPLFSENGAFDDSNKGLHYSMTEISQIVESNNGKIYGTFINAIKDDSVEITLKISNENLSSIDETFEDTVMWWSINIMTTRKKNC
jgi:hypothetical protein